MEKMDKIKLGKLNPKEFIEEFKKNNSSSMFGLTNNSSGGGMSKTFPKIQQAT